MEPIIPGHLFVPPQILDGSPRAALCANPACPARHLLPVTLFVHRQTFIITSTWALGIMGIFLDDYFGILIDHCIEGFPFNMLHDPMYLGSTMSFAAMEYHRHWAFDRHPCHRHRNHQS
jgi:hypothetical protein